MAELRLEFLSRSPRGVIDAGACEACVQRAASAVDAQVTITPGAGKLIADIVYDESRFSEAIVRARFRCLEHVADASEVAKSGSVDLRISAPERPEPSAESDAHHGHDHAAELTGSEQLPTGFFGRYGEIVIVLIGGLFLGLGWWFGRGDAHAAIPWTLFAVSAILTSTRTFPRAIEAVRERSVDVDVLMFIAAAGAASIGHAAEGTFLLFLFGLGAAGEKLALGHARDAISALNRIAPETAHRLNEDGSTDEIPVDEVALGDLVVVRPFDRVPIDGTITDGRSEFDEAAITGESVPVLRDIGDDVYAGTVNTSNRVVIRASKAAGETMLDRIIELVEEAQSNQSPMQQFADKVESVYAPWVLVIAIAVVVFPPLLLPDDLLGEHPWATWFYRGMAFLTAASPCALAIGTPAAVLCGIARSARMGVLFKGGAHLEMLGRVRTICFDKTGTLTRGRPAVTEVVASPASDRDAVLAAAAAVESDIGHPLAEAITRAAVDAGVFAADKPDAVRAQDIQQVAGVGASGTIDGELVEVIRPGDGAPDLWWVQAADAMRERGESVALVRRASVEIGVIGMADEERPESAEVIRELHAAGVDRAVMLTGDHVAAANRIGKRVGIDEIAAELLPEEKLQRIDQLRDHAGPVAMIGDGVNDAPALARADLGIAIGAMGTDVAIETADVVLMGADLRRLPDAVDLAHRSRAIIMQNLIFALATIAIVAPLGALGYAHLGTAVVLHEGSTIVVVLNALRLLRARRRN